MAKVVPRSGRGASARKAEVEGARVPPWLRMLNIGYGNLVAASRVIAIVSPQSAPMRRLRDDASGRGKLVDATQGRLSPTGPDRPANRDGKPSRTLSPWR